MKINSSDFLLTVITPTIGRKNLDNLIKSIENQTISDKIFHILMWDEFRELDSKLPETYNSTNRWSINLPWGLGKNGNAPGSSLRAVALNAADTPYVTFADDDVVWKPNHAETLLESIKNLNWSSCLRNIYAESGEYYGIDNFESVGDSVSRRVPYEMLDGNCMIFKREYGIVASQLYRTTQDRNDDRLLYNFLKEHAGQLGRTNQATINHTCPDFLNEFFKENCTL
jgi:glycosyltransferase involved in cell wall biosynthesis